MLDPETWRLQDWSPQRLQTAFCERKSKRLNSSNDQLFPRFKFFIQLCAWDPWDPYIDKVQWKCINELWEDLNASTLSVWRQIDRHVTFFRRTLWLLRRTGRHVGVPACAFNCPAQRFSILHLSHGPGTLRLSMISDSLLSTDFSELYSIWCACQDLLGYQRLGSFGGPPLVFCILKSIHQKSTEASFWRINLQSVPS